MEKIKYDNIKLVDKKTISFSLYPTRVTYANTLRRIIQTEVPTLGFRADMTEEGTTTDVKVLKNTTPMSNEMLADRIGLLSIAPQRGAGWKKKDVLFKLHVKNEEPEVRYVKASDFECISRTDKGEEHIANTRFFHPDPITQDTSLIAVLKPYIEGQPPEEIHIEAYASLGRGREHTRFNPTCQCSYGYSRDTNPEKINRLWQTWLVEQKKIDPKELEKKENEKRKEELTREFRSLSINRCYLTFPDGEPFSYDFTIESVNSEPVTKIVYRGMIYAAKFVEKYTSLDKGDLPDNIEIQPADARMKGFDFIFSDVDGHTLGNMLQTWIDDSDKIRDKEVSFVGYKVPHPLRNEFVFRIGVEDGKEETARRILAEAAKGCMDMFMEWALEWKLAVERAGIQSEMYDEDIGADEEGEGETKSAWQLHAEMRQRILDAKKKKEEEAAKPETKAVASAPSAGAAKATPAVKKTAAAKKK
jgi:DNA-directed RNA polymerase subunit L/DNA-directed RNA polymerase alpha subunit